MLFCVDVLVNVCGENYFVIVISVVIVLCKLLLVYM